MLISPFPAFLGYAPNQDPSVETDASAYMGSFLGYPHAKIADFGLSEIVSIAEDKNTAYVHENVGSYFWKPPVSLLLLLSCIN
jgi:hypothetical protein